MRFRSWLGIIFLLFSFILMFSCVGLAGKEYKEPVKIEVHQKDGYEEIEIETELTNYIFSTKRGVLKSAFLYFAPFGTQERELIPTTDTNAKNLTRTYQKNAVYPFSMNLGDEDLIYEFKVLERDGVEKIRFSLTGKTEEFEIVKTFTIYNNPYYTLDFELTLRNTSASGQNLPDELQMDLVSNVSTENYDIRYLFDGKRSGAILDPNSYQKFGGLGFVSSNVVFFLENKDSQNKVYPFIKSEMGLNRLGIGIESLTLEPNQESKYNFSLYAGRNRYVLLEESGLKAIVDLGPFSQFLVPVIKLLDWFYRFTGNYGIAIIIFTLITRLILYPLMRKQYYSMAKMQELQPKMKELREKYKDNREKLNKEMMELYKEKGINPLSGCLPMFIQFPILIILWRAILYSAEQIHLSPGFLWMSDLSLHDPYYIIVALSVGSMLLSSYIMSPGGGAEGGGQSKIFMWGMPLFMGFFLRNFPAGMWLYWFLSTIFQVGQQWFINKEIGKSEK